jgi:hypothetical protein
MTHPPDPSARHGDSAPAGPGELPPAAKAICDGIGTAIAAGLQQMADALRSLGHPRT